jgi:hypothetical protein
MNIGFLTTPIVKYQRVVRFSGVRCRIYLQFLLLLPQMAAAEYITQVVGGEP